MENIDSIRLKTIVYEVADVLNYRPDMTEEDIIEYRTSLQLSMNLISPSTRALSKAVKKV